GRLVDLGVEHCADGGNRLVSVDAILLRENPGRMLGDIGEEEPRHGRIVEAALQRDVRPALNDHRSQHFSTAKLKRGGRYGEGFELPDLPHQRYVTAFTASTTSATAGSASFSRFAA